MEATYCHPKNTHCLPFSEIFQARGLGDSEIHKVGHNFIIRPPNPWNFFQEDHIFKIIPRLENTPEHLGKRFG